MVDIARPDIARAKRVRQIAYGVGSGVVVILITVGVSRLEPAAPGVDRDTVYTDTVQRGEMLRQVRGTGTLVPEEIRWISAITNSTVERIVLRPGVTVEPDTVIVELSNPQLEQSALEAQLQLAAAQARYKSRQVELDREVLTQRANVASAESALNQAEYEASLDEELFEDQLVSELQLRQKQTAANQARIQQQIERQRLEILIDSMETQLAAEQAEVDRLETIYELRRDEVADLRVTAGSGGGPCRRCRLRKGPASPPGTNLARGRRTRRSSWPSCGSPRRRRETSRIGQPASIDTRNGIIPGQVIRIDPAVQQGTVHRGRVARRRAAAGRPAGPDRGRHHRARAARGRGLRGAVRCTARKTAWSPCSGLLPDSDEAVRTRVQPGPAAR